MQITICTKEDFRSSVCKCYNEVISAIFLNWGSYDNVNGIMLKCNII